MDKRSNDIPSCRPPDVVFGTLLFQIPQGIPDVEIMFVLMTEQNSASGGEMRGVKTGSVHVPRGTRRNGTEMQLQNSRS